MVKTAQNAVDHPGRLAHNEKRGLPWHHGFHEAREVLPQICVVMKGMMIDKLKKHNVTNEHCIQVTTLGN